MLYKIIKILAEGTKGAGNQSRACKTLVYKRTVLHEVSFIILFEKTIAIIDPIANVAMIRPIPK